MDLFTEIAAERRNLATRLATLSADQLATPSLCHEWTVKEVIAHLVVPLVTPMTEALKAMVRARGRFEIANQLMVDRLSARPLADLLALLDKHAESRFTPPGLDSQAPYTDVMIHGMDIAVPIGLDPGRTPEQWRPALDFLVSPRGTRGFVRRGAPNVRWVATDLDWSSGAGLGVNGPAAALALAMTGRRALVADISGPGADAVLAWQRWA